MKKLLLALILLTSINSYAQEEDVVYYNITSVSYKTGIEKGEVIWSDWYKINWGLRIDYYEYQQTVTIIGDDEDRFYVIKKFTDSLSYNEFTSYKYIAEDENEDKINIEFVFNKNKDFFIILKDIKNNIVMYKIE